MEKKKYKYKNEHTSTPDSKKAEQHLRLIQLSNWVWKRNTQKMHRTVTKLEEKQNKINKRSATRYAIMKWLIIAFLEFEPQQHRKKQMLFLTAATRLCNSVLSSFIPRQCKFESSTPWMFAFFFVFSWNFYTHFIFTLLV